jgi:holo-[acyl-carrier protein] synthase
MIKGIGTDIIELSRIKEVWARRGDRFLQRLFTQTELDYCLSKNDPLPHLAARFAAKEAISKALGTGIGESLGWKEIEITKESSGKPGVELSESAKLHFGNPIIHLSMSHTKEYAIAYAIVIDSKR